MPMPIRTRVAWLIVLLGTPLSQVEAGPTSWSSRSYAPAADGFINLGSGPYPDASMIASGSPSAWHESPEVARLFGGPPSPEQRSEFADSVLQQVQRTFQLSGIDVSLTTDPSADAAHTVSVVSNSTSIPFPDSIGTSELGGNGFSFIDMIAKTAGNVGQMETILAHNVAHELMLTFGVPEEFDKTGDYIDAANAKWEMMTNPTATFSPASADAIRRSLQAWDRPADLPRLPQNIAPQPIPEPTTIAGWGLVLSAVLAIRRRVAPKR